MALTTFGIIVLIGAALSLRFTLLILFPAIIFAIIGVVAHGDSIGAMMLTIGLVATALQIGFLVGIIFRAALASLGVIQSRARAVEEFGLRSMK
jgi:hypothetical protein